MSWFGCCINSLPHLLNHTGIGTDVQEQEMRFPGPILPSWLLLHYCANHLLMLNVYCKYCLSSQSQKQIIAHAEQTIMLFRIQRWAVEILTVSWMHYGSQCKSVQTSETVNLLKEKYWLRWRRRWDPGEKTGNKQNGKNKLKGEMEAIHKTIERA